MGIFLKTSSSKWISLGDDVRSYESNNVPEKKLIAAVIERAISDATGMAITSKQSIVLKESRSAWNWIKTEDNSANFSFNWCCIELDLDPSKLRRIIFFCRKNFIRFRWRGREGKGKTNV